MSNPETKDVVAGRSILYDAQRSSSNGEASCASCHVFGNTDHLSWNLGNPDSSNAKNPQPFPTFKFSELGCDFVGPDEPCCGLLDIINGEDKMDSTSLPGKVTDFEASLEGASLSGLKVGIPKEYFDVDGMEEDVKARVQEAIETFKAQGAD